MTTELTGRSYRHVDSILKHGGALVARVLAQAGVRHVFTLI